MLAVSVVVPARNAERSLPRLLAALARQTLSPESFETIVADDASRDGTARIAAEGGARVVSLARREGSYGARNAALAAAHAPVLAFTDADCVPAEDWLERGLADLERLGAHLMGGRIEAVLGPRPHPYEVVAFARYLDQERYVKEAGFAATANVFIRREVFDATGPFNSALISGGDVEFALRATEAGFDLAYSNEAVVEHTLPLRRLGVMWKGFRTGFGAGQWEHVARGPLRAHRAPGRWLASYRPERGVAREGRVPAAGYRPSRVRAAQIDAAQYVLLQLPHLAGSLAAWILKGRWRLSPRPAPIHYVLKQFPKLSETFVVDEILALEQVGESVIVDSLESPLDEPRHPGLARTKAVVRYVPEQPARGQVLRAHLPLMLRRPATWLSLARGAKADDTWMEFRRAGVVARRSRAERARYIHTHFAYYCADVGGLAARLVGRPFVVTAHANDIWQSANAPHLGRRLSRAFTVITPTEYNARHLRVVAPTVPVRVVPNSVREADPVSPPGDGPVLCVARLVPKKGVDTLIRAVAQLAASWPGLRLELIGEGHVESDLRALTADLGLDGRVAFLGSQPPDAVADAYARCSVFALPCRIADDGDRDGLPIVLLEALARGLPIVTTNAVGIPDVVRDRETGLLVPPDDPDALAAALAELLADRALAHRLGAAGRAFVRERLAWDARIDALREVFQPR